MIDLLTANNAIKYLLTTNNDSLYLSYYKLNELQYKQCGVTPHFPIWQNIFKKYWEKIKIDLINWENFFHEAKPIEKNINKRLTQSIENSFIHRAKSFKKMLRKGKYWQNHLLRKGKHWHIQFRKTFFIGQNLLTKLLRRDKYWQISTKIDRQTDREIDGIMVI